MPLWHAQEQLYPYLSTQYTLNLYKVSLVSGLLPAVSFRYTRWQLITDFKMRIFGLKINCAHTGLNLRNSDIDLQLKQIISVNG
jgi:hypothetical protein